MRNRHLQRTVSPHFLHITRVIHEPGIFEFPRAQEIRARFPDATYIEIEPRHVATQFSGNAGPADRWMENKRSTVILATHTSMNSSLNGRAAHWNLPEQSSGCAMACTYCYVARAQGYAKPVTVFADIDRLLRYVEGHARRQGILSRPDQIDDRYWVYDFGSASDCSVDALISENVWDLIRLFRRLPNAKGSFSTKFVNPEMLRYDPQRKTRMRFSLMPEELARVVDLRTDAMESRIRAINDFYDAGYEVSVSFAPVIVFDGWIDAYQGLFTQMRDFIKPRILERLTAEIEFLTHNAALHEVNMNWQATAEALLWNPQWQEHDASRNDGTVRYTVQLTRSIVQTFLDTMKISIPMMRVRHAFASDGGVSATSS